MLKKLLDILNIHPDKDQRILLISLAVSGLLITYTNPTLTKVIISELPAEYLAFNSLVISLSGLFIGVLWRGDVRSKAVRYFAVLAIIESLCGFMLGLYLCFVEFSAWTYAIASLVYTTVISFFVSKCVMAFKARMWVEKEREVYDNNNSVVHSIVCISGYALALVFSPSLKVSLLLWAICCIIDDIGWVIVYLKNREILKDC